MKVTLEASVDEMDRLTKAMKVVHAAASALWNYNEALRKKIKYEELEPQFEKGVQFARDEFFAALDEYEIDMDELAELSEKLYGMQERIVDT